MGVSYELIDAPYPFVSAIYTCRCGRHAVRHAAEAGTLPPGWEQRHPGSQEEQCLCPECARGQSPTSRRPEQ
jgi:hypothetical protein